MIVTALLEDLTATAVDTSEAPWVLGLLKVVGVPVDCVAGNPLYAFLCDVPEPLE